MDVSGLSRAEYGVPPPTVTATVGHVLIDGELVPAVGKLRPVGQGAEGRQELAQRAAMDERVAVGLDG
jgi:hypothetical protein